MWNGRKLKSVMEMFPFMDTALNFAKSKRPLASSYDVLQNYNGKGGWKDIKETKIMLIAELEGPHFFVTGVFLSLSLLPPER